MNDDELRSQLERRAAGAGGSNWGRGDLLTAFRSAVAVESVHTVRVGGSKLRPLVGLATVAALVLVVAAVLPPRGAPAPSDSPGATPSPSAVAVTPISATQRSGDFTLTITADKPTYRADEPLDVEASLTYDGPQETVQLSGVVDLIAGFGTRQLDGPTAIGPGWDEPCLPHQMRHGEPVRREFSEWAAGRVWAPGRWELTAYADFFHGPDCSAPPVRIKASIVITVSEPLAQLPPSDPVTSQVSHGQFTLAIRADRGHYPVGAPINVDALLTYAGPAATIAVSGVGLFNGFDIEQLDGDARLAAIYHVPCFAHQVLRDQPARLGFVKSGALDDEPPFDRAFFDDPQLRLPAGRWEISVSSHFYLGDCIFGGDDVSLRTSVVIEVSDEPATPTAKPTLTPSPTPSPSPTLWPPSTPEAWLPCDAMPLTIVDPAGIVAECSAAWPPRPPVPNYMVRDTPVANPGTDLRVIDIRYTFLDPDACLGERYQLEISPIGSTDAAAPLIVVPSEECDEWWPIDFVGRQLLVRLTLTRPMPAAWVVLHEQFADRVFSDEDATRHTMSADAPFGRLSLSMSAERRTFLSTEPVSLAAEVNYRTDFGLPTEPVTLYGAFPRFGFVYEQLNGDGRVWDGAMAECAPFVVEPGVPITLSSDPGLRLPPGRWRVSVTASFAGDGCDADATTLHAYVIVRVTD